MKQAMALVNATGIGQFPRLLTRFFKLHLKAESSFSEEEEGKREAAFFSGQDPHLVLDTISFLLEQAAYRHGKPAALQQQVENIHLRQDNAEASASAWSSTG